MACCVDLPGIASQQPHQPALLFRPVLAVVMQQACNSIQDCVMVFPEAGKYSSQEVLLLRALNGLAGAVECGPIHNPRISPDLCVDGPEPDSEAECHPWEL